MKPKRFYFYQTRIFGQPLRYGAPIVAGFMVLVTGIDAQAGDILRGGGAQRGKGAARKASNLDAPTPAATDAARANARDMLARTDRTLAAMRAMQNAARDNANKGPNNLGKNPLKPAVTLPDVPNGLGTGGLKVSGNVTTDPSRWKGAKLPTQTVSNGKTKVTVKQTEQQALLEWETFNIGKNTTLTFDQSKGGENAGQWIAFNKVSDPTANPTQILGKLNADGQVYILNPNGILFGGSSQVNTRGLTASALPINDNLVKQGLLNNRDAQFLFSGLSVPGGADGTPAFNPETPADGRFGDVIVQKGATLTSSSGGGNGGRIMLVGANVTNEGTISTESGQTILAAGLQVAVAAHNSDDPSLRGLDVWVGDVGTYAGTVINNGIIDAPTGSISLTGKNLVQSGILDSTTSVNLNGRIDLKASYGAVANPNFDSTSAQGAGGPMFLNQFTGSVEIGEESVIRILPDYLSKKKVPGTELPERSQINIEGLTVHFGKVSTLLAPNAVVNVRAGSWTYKDANGDRTIFDANGNVEPSIISHYPAGTQRFLTDSGQIHVDTGARISVAGSVDVFVPIDHTLLTIRLLGSELADSPLQRDKNIRGQDLIVDLGDSGSFNGKYWLGTPLGDVTGLAGLIERNAAQLTAKGGDISFGAGQSIVVRDGAVLDVSGGYYQHEGGSSNTSYLIKNGRLVPMKNATPDVVYDGVFNGRSTFVDTKWGVTRTFSTPLFTGKTRQAYTEGAAAGTLSLTAPSMALDGSLLGKAIQGPEQRNNPAPGGTIRISFEAQKTLTGPGGSPVFINHSPTPPTITFANKRPSLDGPEFVLSNGQPAALPSDRTLQVTLSSTLLDEDGFSSLEVVNPDGEIIVPENVTLDAGRSGSIKLSGSNISIDGKVMATGGNLEFTTYNLSPSFVAEYQLLKPSPTFPYPTPVDGRGLFRLGDQAVLSTAGLFTDDRLGADSITGEPIQTAGGKVTIKSFSADLKNGSRIDVSGSAYVSDRGEITYGNAGSISISAGNDPGFTGVNGGTLKLRSELLGYSGAKGGTLSIQSQLVRIGGAPLDGALNLGENFFNQGGFTRFNLTGIGARSTATPPAGLTESYEAAVSIASGTRIRPVASSLQAVTMDNGEIVLERVTAEKGLRNPVSLSFTALGNDDPHTPDSLEIRGDVVMHAGSSIVTDPGASVSFKGGTVTLLGSVITPGGAITVSGAGAFPLTPDQRASISQALPTVHIGNQALLSAAGTLVLRPDAYGRRTGTVLAGGSITVSGNILAEKGAELDVSGASGVLDLDAASLASAPTVLAGNGLTSAPVRISGTPTRVSSNGGIIDLTGSQMLLTDATLLGKAGGSGAIGGTLSISSGRYYGAGERSTSADINLIVRQSGDSIPSTITDPGVGAFLTDENGQPFGGLGHFSLDRFNKGSFNSLELGGKYITSGSSVPYGGNILFEGPVDLTVPGKLRLAAGGIIQATDRVNISASYLAVGQDFLQPQNPNDIVMPFQQAPVTGSSLYQFAPTAGNGSVSFNAGLIDVGTLSLHGISKTRFTAENGDIRGNGTLSAAGEVTLAAARVYPTTLSSFSIFAYDHADGQGSVTIRRNGSAEGLPLSAGGSLSIHASQIHQNGVLQAPLGTITLGWDGTDLDPSDPDLDSPYNIIAGSTLSAPVTSVLTLSDTSVTSVSAAGAKDSDWIIPYGISPDGQTWIDPRGVNITLSGMPEKTVRISGESVTMAEGAVVDIRGGGDLLASRWKPGSGGSVDILGSASASWASGTEYQAGDLVSFGGETWSARVRHSGQSPAVGLYWTKVAESYAIVPESAISHLPYNPFNTGGKADLLGGDPGFTGGVNVGDTVTLEGSGLLEAGTYVLLPSRYALLPGAFLVTPKSGTSTAGSVKTADGSWIVKGSLGNSLAGDSGLTPLLGRFEITSSAVLATRASYEKFSANTFIAAAAGNQKGGSKQTTPDDAGHAAFHGNASLRLAGKLLTDSPGRGASVDVSSFADIRVTSGASGNGGVSISSKVLNSWNVQSLVIGGLRRQDGGGGTVLDVRSQSLTIDTAGSSLSGQDIILASSGSLDIKAGSSILAAGKSFTSETISVSGDGALVRASVDPSAAVVRSGFTGTGNASMNIESGASLVAESLQLDSTNATVLADDLEIETDNLTLGSGRISVVFDGAPASATASSELTLTGTTLERVLRSENLTLQSYSGIDFHGTGTLGGSNLKSLTLVSNGIRGYDAGGTTTLDAGQVTLRNTLNSAASGTPSGGSGELRIIADQIHLGANTFAVTGYEQVSLNATNRLVSSGTGSLSVSGNLGVKTKLVTGESGSAYAIHATGDLNLLGDGSTVTANGLALGAKLSLTGASINADTNILLPSGDLTLTATSGDLHVNGNLLAEGSSRVFNDLIRVADAGDITLSSLNGDVVIGSNAKVSVTADGFGGDAGSLTVNAGKGSFLVNGTIEGRASLNHTSGAFHLDTGSLADSGSSGFTGLNAILDAGGFAHSRQFRVRNGNVTIDSNITSRHFGLAVDSGDILVTGRINASGETGGSISLAAHGNLTLAAGSILNASAGTFDSAGKGGSILLEAGAQRNGSANLGAVLDLQAGSTILLSVNDHVAGAWNTPGSSASEGKFTGTLHLRAPRTADNTDLGIASIQANILGASSVIAEGFKVYQPAGGVMNTTLRNQIHNDSTGFLGAAGAGNANEAAMLARLLSGAPDAAGLQSNLVLAPGVEIVNTSGDLTLGLANTGGSTNTEALAAADWDLSKFRYGTKSAAGVLTLRAQGDVVFNNTLSDGFDPIAQGTTQTFADNGHSLMWLATLSKINDALPVNAQSWSYRITAGSDLASSDFRSVLGADELESKQPGKGSVIVGELHAAVPNNLSSGTAAGIGANGQTADSIRISATTTNLGNRFEVVRTGTGDITVSAGRDVQLRNQFSTIYTAGVAIPTPTTVFSENDFVIPNIPTNINRHPSQSVSGTLGAIQQLYQPVWSMAGGNVSLSAGSNIGRYTLVNGVLTADSSRQMPTNWLYRRGYVDPSTGLFASDGGFGTNPDINNPTNINDAATSTTWWIDYSNFFQGVGTLGGGNIDINAGNDVVNVDAVAPTNARMAGRRKNPDFGVVTGAPEYLNLAPDEANLLELGGGDIAIRAANNIDGGVYYVERGTGDLKAGGSITTNAARSPSLGILDGSAPLDPLTWMPTTLFAGKSTFDVSARGDVLLGPVSNAFLMPQGLNNKYWNKTYFSTFAPDSGVNVVSLGGDINHRTEATLPGGSSPQSLLGLWYKNQNFFDGANSSFNASNYQPWLRLAELDLSKFDTAFKLFAPNLTSTALNGNIHITGDITLSPSASGNLELVASGGVIGLNPTGLGTLNNQTVQVWSASTVNLSDASPSLVPGAASPRGYQTEAGRSQQAHFQGTADILAEFTRALTETGSYTGEAGSQRVKASLHDSGLLHAGDSKPVSIIAGSGDITGLTLFTPKATNILAGNDISDVSFYLQNLSATDVSIVSAGGDIIPFNETSAIRVVADDLTLGNYIGDSPATSVLGTGIKALAGDIRISGPGVLEVLSGGDIDLGTGSNLNDGTGTGITSIGNLRNPFLPFEGADIITLAGLGAAGGSGPAFGLAGSSLHLADFIRTYLAEPEKFESAYWDRIGEDTEFDDLTSEQQAIIALERFYKELRKAGREAAETGEYKRGYKAVRTLFGGIENGGEILTRSREIRTTSGGSISLGVPDGGITMASEIFGNPLTPPGIVTEYGGTVSSFTDQSVDLGQARIFTLRGGDIIMWSSKGNIAAGTSPRTVVTAPPTRVVFDISSASVQTDLGGLATGGGIGVLAAVEGVKPGNVDLIAPKGFIDAGDAGIRVTGNLNIAANTVLNAGNISAAGSTTGSSVSAPAAPSIGTVTSAASANAAANNTATKAPEQAPQEPAKAAEEVASLYTVEVIGYGGGSADEEEDEKEETPAAP
jgi:filamentous hemagglutinin family protein